MDAKTLRQHGLRIGHLEPGAANAITDVAGGEIFVAFSTAASERDESPPLRLARPSVPDGHLDALFSAVVEATEESVLNALWAATDTTGRKGRVVRALPHEPVLELLRRHGRLSLDPPFCAGVASRRASARRRNVLPYSRPDRTMPQTSHTAKAPEATNPMNAITPSGPPLERAPTMDDPTSPPSTIRATAIRLTAWSM